MSDWYNREYERYRGYNETPTESLREKKVREEHSNLDRDLENVIVAYPSSVSLKTDEDDLTTQEIVGKLEEIHDQIDDFSENLKNAERLLNEMGEFLAKLNKGKSHED